MLESKGRQENWQTGLRDGKIDHSHESGKISPIDRSDRGGIHLAINHSRDRAVMGRLVGMVVGQMMQGRANRHDHRQQVAHGQTGGQQLRWQAGLIGSAHRTTLITQPPPRVNRGSRSDRRI